MRGLGEIKIGRTIYILLKEFISMEGEVLYVGTVLKSDGVWHHKIIGKRETGEWYLRV